MIGVRSEDCSQILRKVAALRYFPVGHPKQRAENILYILPERLQTQINGRYSTITYQGIPPQLDPHGHLRVVTSFQWHAYLRFILLVLESVAQRTCIHTSISTQ